MAKSSSTIPHYRRRKPKGSVIGRIIRFLIKLVIAFLLLSVLWVLAYRFILSLDGLSADDKDG